MKNIFFDYTIKLYKDVPTFVYEGLAVVFCIGAIFFLAIFGLKKGLRYLCRLLLTEYLFLFFYKTVFIRSVNENIGHDFHPLWSYGQEKLMSENIMNVVAFMPIGMLLGCSFRNMKWWMVLMIGGGVSITIEALQYFYKRGFAETDDVIHNSLGCLIGFGLYSLVRYGYKRIAKRSVGVL